MKLEKKKLIEIHRKMLEIRHFEEKYRNSEEVRSKPFELILETLASFKRPIAFMETKLRPSVGMGIWQERWMMTKAVEDYLKVCCQEVDRYIKELKRDWDSNSK